MKLIILFFNSNLEVGISAGTQPLFPALDLLSNFNSSCFGKYKESKGKVDD